MSSEQRRTSSDSGDAYARAVLREEKQQQEHERKQLNQDKTLKRSDVIDAEEASDLFRQHSHQQSMEGG